MTLGLSGIIIRLSANVPQHFTNRSVKCEKYMPLRVIIVTIFFNEMLKRNKDELPLSLSYIDTASMRKLCHIF